MRFRSVLSRPAFTLAECLVAVTLLAIGLLGLSGTSLAVERLGDAAARRSAASTLAWSRLEQLRATACVARAGGSAVTRGIAESWTAAPSPGVSLAGDSLRLPSENGRPAPAIALEGAIPC